MSTYNKPTPTKATTLADLVDTKTGGKRKRIDTHVEGIPLGAIVDGAAKAPAQRVVRTPRRMATAAPEPASPASQDTPDVEMSDSAYDADESEDDEDDDILIIM